MPFLTFFFFFLQVAADRTKRKDAKVLDSLEAECQGDGVEMNVTVDFPIGKLGMDLERNAVTKVADEGEETRHGFGEKCRYQGGG
jgi:hypothetical protein